MKLGDIGEFGYIGRLAGRVRQDPSVTLGIGDDAACFTPSPGMVSLVTTDMLLEGVHFDRSFCDPYLLGRKTLAVNLSDVAAMGGLPRLFLLSIAIPQDGDLPFLDRFAEGLFDIAEEHGVTLIGGDTCSSLSGLILSVTLFGEQEARRIVTRGGAQPGDVVYVTGTLGDSALGLALLRKGEREGAAIARHLDPAPRMEAGRSLAEEGIASAMIDVSDGLVSDLRHILTRSRVGAMVTVDDVPLSSEYRARVGELPCDRFEQALAGGEDYELLFTAPPARREQVESLSRKLALPVTAVGTITPGSALRLVRQDGTPFNAAFHGFDHFSRD